MIAWVGAGSGFPSATCGDAGPAGVLPEWREHRTGESCDISRRTTSTHGRD